MWNARFIRRSSLALAAIAAYFFVAFPAAAATPFCGCVVTKDNEQTCDSVVVPDEPSCNNQCQELADANGGTAGTPLFDADASSANGRALSDQCRSMGQSVAPTPISNEPATPSKAFITPQLSFNIPGLAFTPILNKNGTLEVNFIADYVTAIYRVLLGVSVTIAIVMIMIGGFQYVISPATGDVKAAKTRIQNAVVGLVLLLSVYVILFTINPQLTLFNALKVKQIDLVALDTSGPEGATGGAPSASCTQAIANATTSGTCAQGGIVSPTASPTPSCNYHFRNNNFDYTKISQVDWPGSWDDPLFAPIGGTVTVSNKAGLTPGDTCGNHIRIQNDSGTVVLCHMKDFVDAQGLPLVTGETVAAGQQVGHLGGRCCAGASIPPGPAFAEAVCNNDNSAPCSSPNVHESCTCQPISQSGDTTGAHVHTTFGGGYSQVLACLK